MSYTYKSLSTRCAACKCLRRKCPPDCILAPHFPSSNAQRFASVHQVFGAANITKMLEQVPAHMRGEAAECMIFEAATRMTDPVYGSAGIISQLQQQIMQVQNEITKIQGEIAVRSVQQNMQLGLRYDQSVLLGVGHGLMGVGDDVGSSNGQRFELDLDELNASFSPQ